MKMISRGSVEVDKRIADLIEKMTLEEKARMCSGANWFETKVVERFQIPAIRINDGPNGLRKNADDDENHNLGYYQAVQNTCFPTGSAMAASWDVQLLYQIGQYIGLECQAEQVPLLAGPGVNIKRSPLCGRNFEYLSEDPHLGGKLASAYIQGLQSQGVGACLKHFAANNQEERRLSINSVIDEQTLREIYLTAFEIAVKEAAPLTIMCAYNQINGRHCSKNAHILTEILRDEWAYQGIVMTDWGAIKDRVESLKAGLDLEMPYSGPENDNDIIKAVKTGELDESVLNKAVGRILEAVFKMSSSQKANVTYDKEKHHQFARKAASECMVLLKNDNGILPINPGQHIALIGEMAEHIRYQGGGSSHVTPTFVDNILDEITKKTGNVTYAKGYRISEDKLDIELVQEAAQIAEKSDLAIIIAGLPEKCESEGSDRTTMKMPDSHTILIKEVAKVNPNTIVVLLNGAPVEMDWSYRVRGILEAYLGGQAAAGAISDILFGDVNPSGKLAETFPIKLEDNPSYLSFGTDPYVAQYNEGIYVGYRYYEKKKLNVQYPFGHGLSYTTFEYSELSLDKTELLDSQEVKVSLKVKNTGKAAGKEVVQLYVGALCMKGRPEKELRGFQKIRLEPGEQKMITFLLGKRAFAYYNTMLRDWHVITGNYRISVGSSSADIRLSGIVTLQSCTDATPTISEDSMIGDLLRDNRTKGIVMEMLTRHAQEVLKIKGIQSALSDKSIGEVFRNLPIRGVRLFSKGNLTIDTANEYIIKLNRAISQNG